MHPQNTRAAWLTREESQVPPWKAFLPWTPRRLNGRVDRPRQPTADDRPPLSIDTRGRAMHARMFGGKAGKSRLSTTSDSRTPLENRGVSCDSGERCAKKLPAAQSDRESHGHLGYDQDVDLASIDILGRRFPQRFGAGALALLRTVAASDHVKR